MRPLDGVRVLDFFWLGAGPMASLFLQHLGAEVIKIESQSRLDKIREGQPYPGGPNIEHSGVFASLNYGKKSLTLNLGSAEAREVVLDLVRSCDVVTNNFKPHTMQRFGIGYDDLAARNPDLVYITMSTMGEEGPCATYGAYGSHLAAMAGFNGLAGSEGELPVGLGSLFPDFSCNPLHACAAVIAGLRHARATGQGVQIDMSQLESTLHLLGPALAFASANSAQPARTGARHGWKAPHDVYPCRGGSNDWVMISVASDDEWRRLVALVSAEVDGPWADFGTFLARRRRRDELDGLIRRWAAARDRWEASAQLLEAGVSASPVESIADHLERDPLLRPAFLEVPLAGGAVATVQRVPLRMAEIEDAQNGPPQLGEHTFEILTELCGYDDPRIAGLIDRGVLS